ncbi:MAG: glutamate synthase subunit beta [Candidatus Omnitrophica bacterium]|nr:glutamate synthase subunit beta [Candidatus Omnitrophota bacterium]
MGDPRGFLKVKKIAANYRPVCERIKDYMDVFLMRDENVSRDQASRCMDCGTAFCNWGCPLGNYIPEWNDFMFKGNWKKAWRLLDATNSMPEITGRICPALCEYSCVLGINDDPVTIRENELAITEYAFKKGWVKPAPPKKRTGKGVAVIGSGPAGLSCAAELNRKGHSVTVFERDGKIGGILRYGIPDFKLEKNILDRRIAVWKKEGIRFVTGANIGGGYKFAKERFDAVCVASGSRVPRDLAIEGRELKGIHFAMEYLTQANRLISGEKIKDDLINAGNKKVIVIGGGDTGADCVGLAHRQGASCVVQIELLPKPPECRAENDPWPKYPMLLKTSTSHQEGGQREWQILTRKFIGENGAVKKISCVKVAFEKNAATACPVMTEVPGSAFEIESDLVILAIGFLHTEKTGFLKELKAKFDKRGNILTGPGYETSAKGVFAAGDARRGQSLIVWTLWEGREAARNIDDYLKS